MVAVGDQQLGVGQRRADRLDRARVADAPDAVHASRRRPRIRPRGRAASRRRARPRRSRRGRSRARRSARGSPASRASDAGGPRLRPRVGALVRADAPGAVVLDADPGEEAAAHRAARRRDRCSAARAPTSRARCRAPAHPSAATPRTARLRGHRGRSPLGRSISTTLWGERASSAARWSASITS